MGKNRHMSRTSKDPVDPASGQDSSLDAPKHSGSDTGTTPAVTDTRSQAEKNSDGIKHTRAAALYTGLVVGALIVILLMVFILQNLDSVPIYLFTWEFNLPVGIAVLLAAVGGALVMAAAGGVRILQVRRAIKRR